MTNQLLIRNRIAECNDGKHRSRNFENVDRLIVHRIGASLGADGPTIAAAFRDQSRFAAGSYTGGEMPYHFVIRENGTVDQCLTLGDNAPHARRFNVSGLAVGVIGDFRRHAPTPEQWQALREFCGLWLLYGLDVYGHDELPGGSKNPAKQCPGRFLDLPTLRIEASSFADNEAQALLQMSGICFSSGIFYAT